MHPTRWAKLTDSRGNAHTNSQKLISKNLTISSAKKLETSNLQNPIQKLNYQSQATSKSTKKEDCLNWTRSTNKTSTTKSCINILNTPLRTRTSSHTSRRTTATPTSRSRTRTTTTPSTTPPPSPRTPRTRRLIHRWTLLNGCWIVRMSCRYN